MADPRHQKLAQVLVTYSLELKPGQKFGITASPPSAPLVREVFREAIRVGAHPEVHITLEELAEIRLREGNDEQLRYISEITKHELDYFDATLAIWSSENT